MTAFRAGRQPAGAPAADPGALAGRRTACGW
jgi:hypothetical protein